MARRRLLNWYVENLEVERSDSSSNCRNHKNNEQRVIFTMNGNITMYKIKTYVEIFLNFVKTRLNL